MSIRFYVDVHVPYAMTFELRLRGVDVLTAQEDGAGKLADAELLDRASTLGRVLVTQDADFLKEAARRQENALWFAGVVFAPPARCDYWSVCEGLGTDCPRLGP